MTTMEAGRELGVGSERIRQLAKDGRLPALLVQGGIRLFKRADVERLKRERAKAKEAAA